MSEVKRLHVLKYYFVEWLITRCVYQKSPTTTVGKVYTTLLVYRSVEYGFPFYNTPREVW